MSRPSLTLILILAAFVSGLAWNSKPAAISGAIPYETSPGVYSPTKLSYNSFNGHDTLSVLDTAGFYDDRTFRLGGGTRYAVVTDAEKLVLGDEGALGNTTSQTFNDTDHTITMQAIVVLPEIINCDRLGTDNTGKIVCKD